MHGDDTEDSDLDILIDPTPETMLLDIGAIRHESRNLLGIPVDVLTPRALPTSFAPACGSKLGRYERQVAAVIGSLEVIGEASRNFVPERAALAAARPELPLSFAYEMRNALAHRYFKADLGIEWKTVENELPRLRQQVEVLCWMFRRSAAPHTSPDRAQGVAWAAAP